MGLVSVIPLSGLRLPQEHERTCWAAKAAQSGLRTENRECIYGMSVHLSLAVRKGQASSVCMKERLPAPTACPGLQSVNCCQRTHLTTTGKSLTDIPTCLEQDVTQVLHTQPGNRTRTESMKPDRKWQFQGPPLGLLCLLSVWA